MVTIWKNLREFAWRGCFNVAQSVSRCPWTREALLS